MQKNKLVIMSVVTAVILLAAVFAVNKENETLRSDQAGHYLFPDLRNKVNDVTELEIVHQQSNFSVKNQGGEWKVVEKNNYPAHLPKIKQTILRIADLTTIEAKTKRADNYGKIGVEEPTDATASSSLINLKDKDGKVLAALIVGKQQAASISSDGVESLYVRKAGDDQSWLVKGELHIDPKERDWLVTELFDIPVKRVQKVSLSKEGKTTAVIEKMDMAAKDFSLADIPKKKVIKSNNEINAVAEGISNIVIKDVDSIEDAKAVSFDKDVYHADYVTFDGLVISVDTVKARGTHFAKFTAKFDASLRKEPAVASKEPSAPGQEPSAHGKEPSAPSQEPSTQSAEPISNSVDDKTKSSPQDSAAPQLKDAVSVAQEADELSKKFAGWIFEISSTKADNMRKGMDDLVKVSG